MIIRIYNKKALRNELAYFLLLEPFLATRSITRMATATITSSIPQVWPRSVNFRTFMTFLQLFKGSIRS